MRVFFFAITLGLLAATLAGAGLSWDGAYYLFKALHEQTPFVPHGRTINVLLQQPTLLFSRVTDDLNVLCIIFTAGYSWLPLAVLAGCWFLLSAQRPAAFVWPVLGLTLVMLPGRFDLTGEAAISIQLFWLLLVAVLSPRPPHSRLVLITLAAGGLWASHPMRTVWLALASIAAAAAALRQPERRNLQAVIATALATLSLLGIAVSHHRMSTYEQTLVERAGRAAAQSLIASQSKLLVLASIGLAVVMGVLLTEQWWVPRTRAARWARRVLYVSLVGTAAVIIAWASDPSAWSRSFNFKRFAEVITVPVAVIAAVELLGRYSADRVMAPHRRFVIRSSGVIFATVLAVQSVGWCLVTRRLLDDIEACPTVCVPMSKLSWLVDSPLYNWSTVSHAILIQGRVPRRLLLSDESRARLGRTGEIVLADWERPTHSGWFDFEPARSAFLAEVGSRNDLDFEPGPEWRPIDPPLAEWSPVWTRRSDREGRGSLRLDAPKNEVVRLEGSAFALAGACQVTLLVGGHVQDRVILHPGEMRSLSGLHLRLDQGKNLVELRSEGEPFAIRGLWFLHQLDPHLP